jgi:SNF2 family DNA or RNA helicase
VVQGGAFGRVLHYINLPYLTEALYEAGRRVLKKDVLKDLPPMLISEIPVQLHGDHHALYQKLVRERVLELGDRVIDATTQQSLRMKVQQILMTPEHFSEVRWDKNAVVEALDQVVEMVNLGARKVVVFGYFQRSIEKLGEHYKKHNPVLLYGGTKGNRNEHIERFKTDPACRMLIAQVRSGGYGLNLQDVCSHVVFTEIISVPGLFQQAAERAHRPGQTESVTVYLLVTHRTVSVSIRNDLARKSGEAKEVTRDAPGGAPRPAGRGWDPGQTGLNKEGKLFSEKRRKVLFLL